MDKRTKPIGLVLLRVALRKLQYIKSWDALCEHIDRPRTGNSRLGCFCPAYAMGTGFRIHVCMLPPSKNSILTDAVFTWWERVDSDHRSQ